MRQGIVSGRVALLPRSTEIQPFVAPIRPSPHKTHLFLSSAIEVICIVEEKESISVCEWMCKPILDKRVRCMGVELANDEKLCWLVAGVHGLGACVLARAHGRGLHMGTQVHGKTLFRG